MKKLSAKRYATVAVVLVLGLGACGFLKDDSGEVVIRVNGRAITAGEFRDSLRRLVPSEKEQEADELAELKKELVAELVEEELLLEEAGRAGLEVGAKELAYEVDLIKKEYGDDSFKVAIEERYGSVDGWEERIERKLLVRKAIENITSSVKVSDKEAQAYYRERKDEFARPEQVRARMVVVSSEEEADDLLQRLTPANFAEVAREASLSPEGKAGGDLGYFGRGDMPGEFEEVVFGLKPGQMSAVVKTEYGFHIFLLEDRRKGGAPAYSEVKARITERLRGEKAAAILNDWIGARKRNSSIEVREELL